MQLGMPHTDLPTHQASTPYGIELGRRPPSLQPKHSLRSLPAATNLSAPIAFLSTRTTDYSVIFHRPGSRRAWWSLQTHFSFLPLAPIYRITFHARKPRWPRQTLYTPPITSIHRQTSVLLISGMNEWSIKLNINSHHLTND